jgi:lysophospholipase L1-like esterase
MFKNKENKIIFFWTVGLVIITGVVIVGAIVIKSREGLTSAIRGEKKSNKLKKGANILFVGDSMTSEFYNGKPTSTYSYLLKHKYLTDKSVDILAFTSMQTSWMLANLPAQLAKKKYDRVYIWGGVNDIYSGTTVAKAVANVQAMVDLVVKQGGEAYVILGYDTDKFTPDVKATSIVSRDKYVVYQKALKDNITNATIVPEFEIESSMNVDGVHPSMAAHEIIAKELLKGIEFEE